MKWKHFLSIAGTLGAIGCGTGAFQPARVTETAPPATELRLPPPDGMSTEPYFPAKPLWEAQVPGSVVWTEGTLHSILSYAPQLLEGAEDMPNFCRSYSQLGVANRAGVLAFLVSAIARFESGFNPTTRFHETSLGIDPVTGLPVHSEGLLQLSYQDTRWAPFCDFDWEKDRTLSPTDPRKSIFDPLKNLECGVRILNRQVEKRKRLILSSGAYWAVLKSNSAHNKIAAIQALMTDLPACNYEPSKRVTSRNFLRAEAVADWLRGEE